MCQRYKEEITFISENVGKILGYSPTELLGNGWWEKTIDEKTALENEKENLLNKLNKFELNLNFSMKNLQKEIKSILEILEKTENE